MNALRTYWRNLSSRERLLLGVGGATAAVILFYVMVWDPWHQALKHLRLRIPKQLPPYETMKQQQQAVLPVLRQRGGAKRDDATPLLTVVEKTATKLGLRGAIRRMQPGRDDDVQVWMDETGFDRWVQWIDALGKQGIEITDALINRDKENTVSIRATFRRG